MNAMQYKIPLPNDYDMNIIRDRIEQNGYKTDDFQDLFFKSYLIMDTNQRKEYSPFYFWKNEVGMNKFIFDGFYDNILTSFGWQHINIAIPYKIELKQNFKHSNYVIELEHTISRQNKMSSLDFSLASNDTGRVIVYNPDKWKYTEFYFFSSIPESYGDSTDVYEVLHIS